MSARELKHVGRKVSTISQSNGYGFGYVTPDCPPHMAYISGGNGYFYLKSFKQVVRDSGQCYRQKVCSIGLASFFDADKAEAKIRFQNESI